MRQGVKHHVTVFAGSILFLWGPPPPQPPPIPTPAQQAKAARQAASEKATLTYQETFEGLLERPSHLRPSQHGLMQRGWSRFVGRWLAAAKAAGVQGAGFDPKAPPKPVGVQPTGTPPPPFHHDPPLPLVVLGCRGCVAVVWIKRAGVGPWSEVGRRLCCVEP